MENNEITLLQVQKKLKPAIEDVIPFYMDGDRMHSALAFMSYLRENKMKPAWTIHNGWKALFKGKPIYYIRLGKHWSGNTDCVKWVVTPYLNQINVYEEKIFNKNWHPIILDKMVYCRVCNNSCAPGMDKTVLQQDLKGLCCGILYSGRFPVSFADPDDNSIEMIKELIEMEREARKN